jgi:hypothetical protein
MPAPPYATWSLRLLLSGRTSPELRGLALRCGIK